MTKSSLLLTLQLLIATATITRAQPNQVSIIDFYGPVSSESELRKCLPFAINDTVSFLTETAYPKAKKAMVDCLLGQPTVAQADIAFVCCDEIDGKWMAFIGVDTRPKEAPKNTTTRDIKLPAEMTATYDSLMDLIIAAIESGDPSENDSSGHSLMAYPPARRLQEKFVLYAEQHLSLLKQVLKFSKHPEQRAVAATVIAYYHDKTKIIDDLLGAVTDPDEDVRNDAVRAIGIIADYSQHHPGLKIEIPADPFIKMMNSISWTDRNKSAFVLMSLTDNRDKKVLKQLEQQALAPIVDMAKWKNKGHSMPGFILLGRIAGWSEQEITNGPRIGKDEAIAQMQAKIKLNR